MLGYDIQIIDEEPVPKALKGGVVDPCVSIPCGRPTSHNLMSDPHIKIAHPFKE